MAKRVKFNGKNALEGTCACGRVLILTDPDATGEFESHHEAPPCEEYTRRCASAEALGPRWAVGEKDIWTSEDGHD